MNHIYKQTSQKKNNKKSEQIEIIDQEIKDTEGLRQQTDQTIKLLKQEFVTCVNRGEKGNYKSLVSKGMTNKRKRT